MTVSGRYLWTPSLFGSVSIGTDRVPPERVHTILGGDNLRKYLIAAVAATAAIGVSTAAAQSDRTATMKVTVAPKNAGTAKKPVNSSVALTIDNNNTRAVLTKLAIQMPKTLKVSGKGFPACSKKALDSPDLKLDSKGRPTICKSSRVGGGTAKAQGGINSADSFPVEFKVTAITGGADKIYFYLHGQGGFAGVNVVSPGKVTKTKKGPLLTVTVPQEAQNLAGLWNGLVQLKTTLKGSKGSHKLIATTGCKNKKQPFSTDLTFGRTFAPDGTTDAEGKPNYAQGAGYKLKVAASSACTK
jgi:hypothetical protein